jgi:ABC-type multidrug transport system permease subunit
VPRGDTQHEGATGGQLPAVGGSSPAAAWFSVLCASFSVFLAKRFAGFAEQFLVLPAKSFVVFVAIKMFAGLIAKYSPG